MKLQFLRERIEIEKQITTQSATGAISKSWQSVCKPFAWKRRRGASGITEIAHEDRNEQVATITIWKDKRVTYDCRIKWLSFIWFITMIEVEGREMTLTLKKADE